MKEEDHKEDPMMEEDLMEKIKNLYVTSVTILDTSQGIAEHLIVIMEPTKEGMHLYVIYVITLDTTRYCRMDRRNFNRNPNHKRNGNKNDRNNDNNNDNSQKEEIKEQVDEFREAFVKAKDLENCYKILEEQYFDALDEKLKLTIVCDSSYLN